MRGPTCVLRLPAQAPASAHMSGAAVLSLANTLQRPTGQCSTVMSSMGKSAGLPVAK